jgi:magnesium chelatase family protein
MNMVARTWTVAFQGIDVLKIEVQVQISNGLPALTIVGLPDKAVAESRERIRSALHSIGLSLPPKRITVNLAPADVQKEGSHYDLPVAIGLLAAMEIAPKEEIGDYIVLGELSLDGRIRPVAGILPTGIEASAQGLGLICPYEGATEAGWVQDLKMIAAPDLVSLLNHFKGNQLLIPPPPQIEEPITSYQDMKDVKGQATAKRALEIAAAGGHNMIMIGPPGAGKSMLASRLPGILPPLEPKEALELTMIYSLAGILPNGKLLRQRPFRDPHHSASLAAMVGGGSKAKPGEISLAHHGVLFLDELPEFSSATLESLRQPLETGHILVARANAHISYPAQLQLIAAMNPCRCGHLGTPEFECSKAPKCGLSYQAKISGPLLDRIDLQVEMTAVRPKELHAGQEEECSTDVLKRVLTAREYQRDRYQNLSVSKNAALEGKFLEQFIPLEQKARTLIEQAAERYKFSARSYHRILKVARTIADLETTEIITHQHIAEALSYRRLAYS